MKTETAFNGMTDRYAFDFGECAAFVQMDSKQDASYYGTWANPETLRMVSYCEGDITRTQYDTEAEFVQGVREWIEWSRNLGCGGSIDPAGHERRLIELGLADLCVWTQSQVETFGLAAVPLHPDYDGSGVFRAETAAALREALQQ